MNKQLPTAFSQQNAKKQQSRSSFFKPGSVYNAASSDSMSDVLGGHTRQFVSDSKFVSKFAFHDYSGIAPVCLPRTSFTLMSVSSSVNSTGSSSASSSTSTVDFTVGQHFLLRLQQLTM
jgi:hypothetical protein